MESTQDLLEAFDRIKLKATSHAGELDELCLRARVYHRLYRHSDGNFVFPLIAAHGALWAKNYFRFAMSIGRRLAQIYALQPDIRDAHVVGLDEFANEFREINRRVCIDTYTWYHFIDQFHDHPLIAKMAPSRLLKALQRCHCARRQGFHLSKVEKEEVFDAFFLNEQETIVRPIVDRAAAKFEWKLMKNIALRPRIRFSYFKKAFWFRNFTDTDERIERGKLAFSAAAEVGFDRTEKALMAYRVLPENFLEVEGDEFGLDQFQAVAETAI
jgi:hypothetical protein